MRWPMSETITCILSPDGIDIVSCWQHFSGRISRKRETCLEYKKLLPACDKHTMKRFIILTALSLVTCQFSIDYNCFITSGEHGHDDHSHVTKNDNQVIKEGREFVQFCEKDHNHCEGKFTMAVELEDTNGGALLGPGGGDWTFETTPRRDLAINNFRNAAAARGLGIKKISYSQTYDDDHNDFAIGFAYLPGPKTGKEQVATVKLTTKCMDDDAKSYGTFTITTKP